MSSSSCASNSSSVSDREQKSSISSSQTEEYCPDKRACAPVEHPQLTDWAVLSKRHQYRSMVLPLEQQGGEAQNRTRRQQRRRILRYDVWVGSCLEYTAPALPLP